MSGSPYSALRARLVSRTVEHYLRPTFRVRDSAEDSGEYLRFDALLDQLPDHRSKFAPKPKTWLVTGGAGSGKSTAVLQCAIALLDRETPCAIIDNRTIRQLDVHGLTAEKLAWQLRPSGIDVPLWKQHVRKNRVVFLVDALNEVQREFGGTSSEWKFILKLVSGAHDFTVLATSRSRVDNLDWTLQRDVETLAIEPLGEQDIETYLGMRDGSATEALTEIRTGDMLGVASNPFMLSLLTDWLLGTRSVKDRKIPRSRADLLLETVVRPRTEGRFGTAGPEEEAARRGLGMKAALAAAALAAITTGRGNADFLAVDVEALLGRVWDDKDAIAHTVKAFLDTQMVEPVGDPEERQYSLLHPAFVDFGLALAWQSTGPPPVVLDPGYLDQCLGDWVGLQPDPDGAVLGLLAEGAKPLPPELVVDVLLANRGVLSDEVRGVLWRQLGECFTQGRQTRDRLAGALAGVPRTVLRDGLQRGLLRTLNANDPVFADTILDALWNGSLDAQSLQRLRQTHQRNKTEPARRGAGRDEAMAAKRREWLREDPGALGRRRSANWLGANGNDQDVDDLRAAMRDDPEATVRGASATALGLIGSFRAVPALLETTEGDPDPNVRGSAATALGRIGHPEAVPALTTALAKDTEANVRGSAATALGRIGDPQAIRTLITALAEDARGNVRGSAADALGHIGDPRAVPTLTDTLAGDADAIVQGSAAKALGRIGDPQAIPTLTAALTHGAAGVRGAAATALGLIGHPEAVPALTTALAKDADAVVQGSAAKALGRIGDPRAVPALTDTLAEDTDGHTRGSAANALGRIGDARAVPALTTALAEDTNEKVRGSAANALGHIGDTSVADVLRATIGNPEETYVTRRAAVGSLAHLDTGDESWITEIADRLRYTTRGDPDGSALRGAIVHLVARREITPKTKAWLVGVIHDDRDPLNRTTAIEGLARAGQADPDLIKFIIAPERPRSDNRPRDSDAGVLGVAAAAVVRAAADDPAYTDSLLPSIVRLLTQENIYWATVNPPFTQLRLLPLTVAERVFARLEELVGDSPPQNPHLETALAFERESLAERRRVQAHVESFSRRPEAVLAGFRDQRKSRFEVTAPSAGDEYHVALLTAVPVETKALFHVLDDREITTTELQRDGRYYDVFDLASAGQTPVRVVTTQATDQGGQSAAAVTRDLLSTFRPHLVLLVGVCGGFGERGVSLGDVLLAREVFDYGPEKVRPEGGGLRPQVYRTDEQVLRLVTRLDTRGRLDASLDGHELLVKDFASGEKVIAWRDSDLRAQLLGLSADIGGVETEAHGVLHAIWEAFKAKEFVGGAMLKCVSDLGDEEMTVGKKAKQTEAARRAARVALDVAAAFRRADA
ncbi:HEAT repeat domain-containing protein [Streptomyces sp. DH24]|uniref:HEAT repeat domain-containing protein n=1 Tax=Streptomyces sp. DH24 TaxID=3040123 RepID=UPI002441BAA0|nr:HEAT repeat domain-containing protein [Streptomyces sp. DH24]MDG9718520.1 HEAT repeat domain-containing protein [Streptomyces sp. DH24]